MKDSTPGMVWAKTPLAERTANARALRWVDPALWEELQAGCGSEVGGEGGCAGSGSRGESCRTPQRKMGAHSCLSGVPGSGGPGVVGGWMVGGHPLRE